MVIGGPGVVVTTATQRDLSIDLENPADVGRDMRVAGFRCAAPRSTEGGKRCKTPGHPRQDACVNHPRRNAPHEQKRRRSGYYSKPPAGPVPKVTKNCGPFDGPRGNTREKPKVFVEVCAAGAAHGAIPRYLPQVCQNISATMRRWPLINGRTARGDVAALSF